MQQIVIITVSKIAFVTKVKGYKILDSLVILPSILQQVRQENVTLVQEVKVTKEKAVTQAAPPATNGDIHDKNSMQIDEHERM